MLKVLEVIFGEPEGDLPRVCFTRWTTFPSFWCIIRHMLPILEIKNCIYYSLLLLRWRVESTKLDKPDRLDTRPRVCLDKKGPSEEGP